MCTIRLSPCGPITFSRNQQGVAAIEFAIVANLFLLLLAGIAGFGVYLSAGHSLQQLSAEAARTAIRGIDQGEQTLLVNNYISANGGSYPLLQGVLISSAVSHPTSGSIAVTVSYNVDDLPVISMLPFIDFPDGKISASSTVRIGG